jgi:hypothetical protein
MLNNKKTWIVVALILASSLLSILGLINKITDLSCLTLITTNILIPIIATRTLLRDIQARFQSSPGATGALIGLIAGFIPSTVLISGAIVLYYITSGKQITASSKFAFATFAFSLIAVWIGSIIISAITGLISSIRFRQK